MIYLDEILPKVTKPARYTGGEWNSVVKDWDTTDVRVALTYPDVYEIGMSNYGLAILYDIVNRHPHFLAERTYTPWFDMEEEMVKRGVPLFSLESKRPIKDFDIFGFSLGWEMTYTNVLNMLALAQIPVLARDRAEPFPLIIGGGSCTLNGEPLADFFDLFVLGEGEEVIIDLCEAVWEWKKEQGGRKGSREDKRAFLRRVAQIPGIYVPSLYQVVYHPDGTVDRIEPIDPDIPRRVARRVVEPLPPVLTRPIVPYIQTVHDRGFIEIQRGCTRGCRFCQAGIIYRPLRERSHREVLEAVDEIIRNCGYSDFSLVSLSTSDYHDIPELVRELAQRYRHRSITVSLPSLRVETVSVDLVEALERKRSGLTFAPEAGSQRLRNAINKPLTDEDFLKAVEAAFSHGWNHIKLYYMIGLPTETLEDVQGIVELTNQAAKIGKKYLGNRARLSVNINIFIPKPHSQYQWAPLEKEAQVQPKIELVRKGLKGKGIQFSWAEFNEALLEAVLARGDRRVGAAILRAWQLGAKFDAWSEHFRWEAWERAFEECGLAPEFYTHRERPLSEVLPWAHVNDGVTPGFLWREYRNTWKDKGTEDCRYGVCSACGLQDDPNCSEKFHLLLQKKGAETEEILLGQA